VSGRNLPECPRSLKGRLRRHEQSHVSPIRGRARPRHPRFGLTPGPSPPPFTTASNALRILRLRGQRRAGEPEQLPDDIGFAERLGDSL
jgi:hypothetical protein